MKKPRFRLRIEIDLDDNGFFLYQIRAKSILIQQGRSPYLFIIFNNLVAWIQEQLRAGYHAENKENVPNRLL